MTEDKKIHFAWLRFKLYVKSFSLKKILYSFSILTLLVAFVKLFSFAITDSEDDLMYKRYFNKNYKIFGVTVPDGINFCGEPVPTQDFEVRERLDRELLVNTYWQSQTLLFHKKAHRWFPIIEPILKRHGIPDDVKYLAVIESGLSNTISPSGATGYWQLMEGTAKQYGLVVDKEIDERYHVEKSTEAACKYMKDAYKAFNSWTMAAASYNMGISGLNRQLENQKINNFYDLLLNQETSRYVFRIMAVKEILERPQEYGYYLRKKDLYPQLKTYKITVDSSVTNFMDFAAKNKVTYKVLKYFNPWIRQSYLTNKERKTYTLELPVEGYTDFEKLFGAEPASSRDSLYVIDYSKSDNHSAVTMVHMVRDGETLQTISKKYKVDAEKIRLANKLKETDTVKVNQELIIPN